MIEQPPPRPRGDPRKLDMVELRMGILLRELDAESHPTVRAALLYHMGSLYEHELGRTDEAVALYRQAGDADPGLLPATIARLRIAERAGRGDETKALCAALAGSAAEPALRAAALSDLALQSHDWASLMRDAVACAVEPAVPALLLEWLARARGYDGALEDALRSQAESAADPGLQSALWLDLALSEIDDGRIDAGLESLELACESSALAWSARSLQRRAAREHGRLETWRDASIALAELLEADPPTDPLDISVPEDERPAMAAFLWQEAATLSALGLGDGATAERCWSAAVRLQPGDRELHLQALLVAEAANDADATVRAASWFTEQAPDDPAFAAFSIRQAVSRLGDQTSLDLLRRAVRDHPESAYAQAARDVALISMGRDAERAERLRERADSAPDAARSRLLWQAARLAAGRETPSTDAQALYTEAADASDDAAVRVLRDALDIALERGDPDGILARASDLLEHDLSPGERGRLCYLRYAVTHHARRDELGARLLLVDALGDRACRAWAPHVARSRAALSDDAVLLARAHEALADSSEADTQIGHWCAAGRAHVRAGDWAQAEHAFREALRGSPSDDGILGALEYVLREGGRPEEVVALHEARSQALREDSLMLAGATAERNGDLDSAKLAYEEALRQNPDSPGAALALADLARRRADSSGRLEAYARLADASLAGGVSELAAFLRADGLQGVNGRSADASRHYETALEQPVTAVSAAVALLSTPRSLATDDQRAAAEEVLADAGAALHAPGREFASAYAALQSAVGESGSSAGNAWLEIAARAPTESLRSAASLQGLRDIRLSHGEQAEDELFMLAHDFNELADGQTEAAIAMDEALGPGDDPELLVSVLRHRLHHSTDLSRGALDAAHCRALVEADRGREAIALLTTAVDERPDDLSVWETLRTAARQAEEWPLVAQACERLAQFVDADLKADLLEEAGSVRLDCLEQHQQAEVAFRAALDADPTREIAFRRLHDLLTAREDADALEALISARLALGEAIQRPDLLYERARLLRGFSDRPGALEVLDELFGVEPEHAGALALAAEVHVSLEQWEEAVDCLRRLSRSDIPDDQRRVAHLGAADFLENRLGAKDAALEELRAVQALGLADAVTWMRIGAIEEELGRPEAAADAYREVFAIDPSHGAAAARLEALLSGEERLAVVSAYEDAVWARIDDGSLVAESLEGLRKAASWRGDFARLSAVIAAENALGGDQDDDGPVDLAHVSMAALWDPDSSTVVEEVMRRAGPSLSKERIRAKKVSRETPVFSQLEGLSERFGGRFGSVAVSASRRSVTAYLGRDDELCWVVPERSVPGLSGDDRFAAGRIAWAFTRGGGPLLDQPAPEAAGTLVAILRGARCRIQTGGPVLPAASVELRRAVRKSVQEIAADAELRPEELVAAARRLHRSADRAGLLASGDIRAGLAATCGGNPTFEAARTSERALDLLRFWMAPSSPLWGSDV